MHINGEPATISQLLVAQWIAAFNAHDVAMLIRLYTQDAELFDSGMKRPRQGQTEIERWFTGRFYSMPSITYTPTSQVLQEGEEKAAVTWTSRGRTPRLLKQHWLSRPFQVDGVSVFTLHNGLIARQRGYYDHLAVVERVIPPLKWFLPSRL